MAKVVREKPNFVAGAQINGVELTADLDLTAIAALTPSNDDFIQRKSGAWVSRSMAQLKTDLVLAKADVGLGNADNTADTAKPVSTAQQTALNLKSNLASPVFTGSPAAPTPDFNDASTALATTQYVDRLTTWEVWTPQIDQGATTNIAKTIAYASYIALGKLVMGQARLTLTAAGTAGSSITISAPIAASASANLQVGSGAFFDASASLFYRILARYTAATDVFEFNRCDATANTLIGVDPNVALASGDIILFNFFYQIP